MKNVTRTQVRIPEDLMSWLKEQAKAQNRSMNAQLVEVISAVKKQVA